MLAAAVLLLVVGGAMGGVPQCNSWRTQCIYEYGPAFPDALNKVSNEDLSPTDILANLGGYIKHSDWDALCSPKNWLMRDACYGQCPLYMELTAPDFLKGMRVCLADNKFTPYSPEGHFDEDHPLMGKELDLEIVGDEKKGDTRHGCVPSDFQDGKNYTGKAVIVERGTCYFYEKFVAAKTVNPAAALMMNRMGSSKSVDYHITGMTGMQEAFKDMPTAMFGRYDADIIQEVYDSGVKIKVKFGMNCDVQNAPDYVSDNCPVGILEDACIPRENPAERLCGQCKLSYTLGDNKTRCLYGNDLQPRKADNYMWAKYPMPISEHVYYVYGGGCSPDDYIGLEGKVAFVYQKSSCRPLMVYYAYKAKVKALILGLGSSGDLWMLGGTSVFGVPVHSVHPDDYNPLREFIQEGERLSFPGNSRRVYKSPVPINFTTGDMLETYVITPAPTMAPPPPEVTLDERPDFEWSISIVVCVVLIVLLGTAILAKFLHQRRNSVDLPPQGKDGFALPLSVASMGLSLTLLAIIAVVGFVLAYNAGQSATNTALDNGRVAVQRTYDNAVENVEELASHLMSSLRQTVTDELGDLEDEATRLLSIIRRTFYYMDSTWNSFNSYYDLFVQMDRASQWDIVIRTTNHFFMAKYFKSDDRAKNDPHISTTNDGLLYGINKYTYDSSAKKNTYWSTYLQEELQAFKRIGSAIGDPFAYTLSKDDSTYIPYITKYAMAMEFGNTQPLSFLCNVRQADGDYLGVAEVQIHLSYLGEKMKESAASAQTENVTVVIFDSTGDIISTSNGPYRRQIDEVFQVSYDSVYSLLKIDQTFTVQVNALAGYIKRSFGGPAEIKSDTHMGSFEQSDTYTHPPTTVIRVDFDNGVQDEAGNQWHMASTGALVPSDRPGPNPGMALRLDGTNAMHIFINLTVDIDRVARTRVNTSDGSWKSSFEPYAIARPLPGGELAIHALNPSTKTWHPHLREEWHVYSHTISLWVKPDETIPEKTTLTTPQLFIDEHEVNPTVSVLGNGRLYVGRFEYGCRTDPVPGGIRGGEWVHFTAVVDYTEDYCAMYINGTLHSKGKFAIGYGISTYGRPYRVGYMLKGLLDDIVVHNTSMTDAEVADMFNTRQYRRQVPHRNWMVQISQTKLGSGSGLIPLNVAVMVPSDDILRQVQANNEKTRHNLDIQERNTQKKLNHMTNETLFVLVVIALFSVLLFLVFNDLLTRPFATFACQMTDIAVMKVDEIEIRSSFIREMNAMHRAMALMVGNLKEYKSYMPQTLLAINESSDDDEADNLLSDVATSKQKCTDGGSESHRSSVSKSSRSTTSRSGRSTHNSGGKASQEQVLYNVTHAKGKKAGMMLSLSKKKVTFAVVNIVNWHATFQGEADSEMIAVHGMCLNSLLVVFQACKGVPDQFSGDRILCSFNACKPLATHRVSACRAVLLAAQKIHDMTSTRPISLSVGVASGEAKVGNMGTEGMKKFSFISPVLTWTYALERYCRSMELPNLVDVHVSEEAKTEFLMQHVDSILFKKRHATRPIRVSQLVRQKDSKDIEWMYQMDEGERTDPFATWNEACKAVFSGDWKEAEKHAVLISADHTGALLDRLLLWIQKKEYIAPTITYH